MVKNRLKVGDMVRATIQFHEDGDIEVEGVIEEISKDGEVYITGEDGESYTAMLINCDVLL